jgi:hypothetical protein
VIAKRVLGSLFHQVHQRQRACRLDRTLLSTQAPNQQASNKQTRSQTCTYEVIATLLQKRPMFIHLGAYRSKRHMLGPGVCKNGQKTRDSKPTMWGIAGRIRVSLLASFKSCRFWGNKSGSNGEISTFLHDAAGILLSPSFVNPVYLKSIIRVCVVLEPVPVYHQCV